MDNHIIIRDPAVKHECRRIKTKQLIMQKPKIVIILVHTLCAMVMATVAAAAVAAQR